MEASRIWTGRRSHRIDDLLFAARVDVLARPVDSDGGVSLSPEVDAELIRVFGAQASHYAQGIAAGVEVQIAWANVAGEMPAVGRSRFQVEVIGVRCSEGAPRKLAEDLFLAASMNAVVSYLLEYEAEAAKHA